MPLVSESDRLFLRTEGYLVVDPELPAAFLDEVLAEVDALYADRPDARGVWPSTRVQDAWKRLGAVPRIAEARLAYRNPEWIPASALAVQGPA